MKKYWSYWLSILFSLISYSNGFTQPATSSQGVIDTLISRSDTTPDGKDKLKVLGEISWEYINQSKYQLARNYADSIVLLASKLNDSSGKIFAQFYFGVIERHQGNYMDALDHIQHFIRFFMKAGDSPRVAAGLFQFAAINTTIGKYQDALTANYRILEIHKKNNYQLGVAFTQNVIGVIHRKMKKHDYAIKAYTAAIQIYDSMDASKDKADVMGNLANVYVDIGQYRKALDHYRQAQKIDEYIGYEPGVAYDLENIGSLYDQLKQYDSALTYQLKALEIRKRYPEIFELVTSLNKTGQAHLQLHQPGLAEPYLMEALRTVHTLESKPLRRDIYQNMARLYADKKEFTAAYQYQQLYAQTQDSILNEEIAHQINLLHIGYETEKKDQQIVQLAQEKRVQEAETRQQVYLKKTFIGGTILVLLSGILLAYILTNRLKMQKTLASKNEEIIESNYRKQLTELELKALQAQINPHFIFNCINSINQMILREENDQASAYLGKFARLIRLVLENAANDEVSLTDELSLLRSYIELEELRFKGIINLQIEIDDAIDPDAVFIPPMILQPIVENSILHGLMLKEDKTGYIHIRFRKEPNKFVCSIEDNGIGREKANEIKQSAVWKKKSMGLNISQERLKLLSKDVEKEFIQISDLKNDKGEPTGTKVEVDIPTISI